MSARRRRSSREAGGAFPAFARRLFPRAYGEDEGRRAEPGADDQGLAHARVEGRGQGGALAAEDQLTPALPGGMAGRGWQTNVTSVRYDADRDAIEIECGAGLTAAAVCTCDRTSGQQT